MVTVVFVIIHLLWIFSITTFLQQFTADFNSQRDSVYLSAVSDIFSIRAKPQKHWKIEKKSLETKQLRHRPINQQQCNNQLTTAATTMTLGSNCFTICKWVCMFVGMCSCCCCRRLQIYSLCSFMWIASNLKRIQQLDAGKKNFSKFALKLGYRVREPRAF